MLLVVAAATPVMLVPPGEMLGRMFNVMGNEEEDTARNGVARGDNKACSGLLGRYIAGDADEEEGGRLTAAPLVVVEGAMKWSALRVVTGYECRHTFGCRTGHFDEKRVRALLYGKM